MSNVATLSLAVDSRPVEVAAKDLDAISAAGARAERQSISFGKSVEDAGKRAAAANDNAARSAERATKAFDSYRSAALLVARAVGAIVGAAAGTALVRFADEWSDMQSRVGAAIKNMEAAPVMMQRIVEIANASYSPLAQTVEIYGRNVAVLRDLGRTATEAADFTEALNHALVTTATKGQDADVVLNALSRSIAVGGLRSMEFETIMSRSPRVLEAIADELGINIIQLRKFAQEGKVTGDVIVNALINNLERLRKEAGEMPATIGDAFTRIRTNLTAFVGRLDKTVGASEAVASALLALADNIARVVTYVATAIALFGVRYVGAMALAYASTITLTRALAFLRVALIRTGIGLLVVGAGELVYQFTRLYDATGSMQGALQEFGRRALLVFAAVQEGFEGISWAMRAIWRGAMADILQITRDNFREILEVFGVSVDALDQRIANLRHLAWNAGEAAKHSFSIAQANMADAFAPITIPEGTVSDDALPPYRPPADLDDAAKKAADAYKRLVDGVKEFIAAQQLERQVIGMTDLEANKLRYTQDLLNDAVRAGVDITQKAADGIRTKAQELADLASLMAVAENATRKMQEAFDFAKDVTKGFFDDLFQGLRNGDGLWKSFANAAISALDKIAQKLIDMALNELINGLLRSIMGAFGGGLGGGIGGDPWAGMRTVTMHSGGIVGRDYSSSRIVHPAIFMNAPRYHNGGIAGLRPNEVPAILERGERIIPANANHANQNARVEVEVFVNDDGTLGAIARQAGAEVASDVAVQVVEKYDRARQKRYQAGGQFG